MLVERAGGDGACFRRYPGRGASACKSVAAGALSDVIDHHDVRIVAELAELYSGPLLEVDLEDACHEYQSFGNRFFRQGASILLANDDGGAAWRDRERRRVRRLKPSCTTGMDDESQQLVRDAALVRRIQCGDERALAEFCDVYLPRLYRFVKRRVPRPEDADDLVQVVLSNAARRIETYRGDSSLYGWLLGICRREVSKQLVRAARQQPFVRLGQGDVLDDLVASLEAPSVYEPDVASQRAQVIGLVQECLDSLPVRYAEALQLKYVEGYSSKEIAERFALSDDAVQSLLARARRTFREVCDDQMAKEMGDGDA